MHAHWLHSLAQWLENTPLSQLLQNVSWIIPTVQTIHILSIAVVIAAIFFIDLRLLGIAARSQPTAQIVARFLPGMWIALGVLLLSGSMLIIAEPDRSLENPAFQVKMALLLTAIALTLGFRRPLRTDPTYWETSPGRRAGSKGIAIVSLLLWVCILFAGRWIAYAGD